MKLARTIILSLSAVFLIIGVHQTITLGFEISYFIFMLSVSMFLLYILMGNVEKSSRSKKKKVKTEVKSKKKKRDQMAMNRQAKRHMERLKS